MVKENFLTESSSSAVKPRARSALGERYRLTKVIKRGAGVETLLAERLDDRAQAIVKRTRATAVSAALAMRLEHEAAVLARMPNQSNDPYLIDHGRDDGWI